MTLEVAIPLAAALSVGAIYAGTRLGRMRAQEYVTACGGCIEGVRDCGGACALHPENQCCECSRPAQACSCDQSPVDEIRQLHGHIVGLQMQAMDEAAKTRPLRSSDEA